MCILLVSVLAYRAYVKGSVDIAPARAPAAGLAAAESGRPAHGVAAEASEEAPLAARDPS